MSSTTVFSGIATRIKQSYTKASTSGACLYTDSELIELDDPDTGIPLELRYAPQLAKKPTAAKHLGSADHKSDQAKPAPRDPFAEPYPEPDLYVHEEKVKEDPSDASGDTFVLLLNKFCIVPRHFLLVTKEFEKQERPLTPLQLLATYSVLKSLGTREKHLAFYNCGSLSGASVQFIPLSNGVAPFDNFIQENKSSNPKDPFQLPLPYASFTVMLAPPSNGDLVSYLGMTFLSLLDLMIEHLRRASLAKSSSDESSSDPSTRTNSTTPRRPSSRGGLSGLSYNLIMTENYLQIIPRSKDSWSASGSEHQVSVNSLGFAGMLLVKYEDVLDEVKKVGVMSILKEVGVDPVVSGELGEEVQDEE